MQSQYGSSMDWESRFTLQLYEFYCEIIDQKVLKIDSCEQGILTKNLLNRVSKPQREKCRNIFKNYLYKERLYLWVHIADSSGAKPGTVVGMVILGIYNGILAHLLARQCQDIGRRLQVH